MKKIVYLLVVILGLVGCNEDTFTPLPNPGNVIKSFKLSEGQVGNERIVITPDFSTVVIKVLSSVDLTSVKPVIKVSEESSVSPASGEAIDVSVNKVVEYKITSESGEVRTWKVTFEVIDANKLTYGVYVLSDIHAADLDDEAMSVSGDILYNEKYWDGALINTQSVKIKNISEIPQFTKWHIIYEETVNNVDYYKFRNLFTGKYLTAPTDNTNVINGQLQQIGYQPVDDNKDLKLWSLESNDGGVTYKVKNKKSGFVLARTKDNNNITKIVQNEAVATDNQLWKFTKLSDESYRDDTVVNFFERNGVQMGSVAFDQGNSIPLTWGANAGKVLWVTQDAWDGRSLKDSDGDGITDMFQCGQFFSYNNSILIQPSVNDWDPTHTVNITNPNNPGKPRQVSPNVAGTDRTWISAGVEVGEKVYIHAGEGNGLNNLQNSIRVLTQNAGLEWQEQRISNGEMPGGSGMVKGINDDYIYSYSTRSVFGYDSKVFVSRFHKDDASKWTHWNGTAWTTNIPDDSGAIGNAYGSTGVNIVNGKYVLMTMQQGFNCDDNRGQVYISTASSPNGPFSTPKKVYQITDYLKGKYTRYYTPIIHPHADNGKNELLLTYSVNFEACGQNPCDGSYLNPYYYRVKAIRVPYEMIGL